MTGVYRTIQYWELHTFLFIRLTMTGVYRTVQYLEIYTFLLYHTHNDGSVQDSTVLGNIYISLVSDPQ